MREHREKCGERKRNEIAGYVRQSNLCVSGDSDTTLDNNFRHGSGQKANLANTHTHTHNLYRRRTRVLFPAKSHSGQGRIGRRKPCKRGQNFAKNIGEWRLNRDSKWLRRISAAQNG